MIAFPHTCFSRFRANPLNSRVFKLLFLGIFLVGLPEATEVRAETPLACEELDRAKWNPNPLGQDYFALLLEISEVPLTEVSMTSCWACGLWKQAPSSYPEMPEEATEALLFQRAQCHRALGMQKELLEDCRTILRRYPRGNYSQEAIQSIVEVLVQQGNHKAVASLFGDLDVDLREDLLPTTLYLIAQSFYALGMDEPAEELLKQLPPDAEAYAYALYMLAQIFYRKGDPDRALLIIRVVHDAPPEVEVPQVLKEMAWLTQARMLYQQKSYAKAIEGFQALRQSSYFLPEALMGMGWCYKAQGDFPKSIAFFQAVESSYADVDILAEAQLEMADVFAKAKSYPDAFQAYRNALNDLHFRISQYKKYGTDPEWLTWLAERFLDRPWGVAGAPAHAPMMNQEADLPEEMEPLLERAKYVSPRLKTLFGIREGLEQIDILLDEVASPASTDPAEGTVVPDAYPPLDVTVPSLEPSLAALLDITFALLDTEYRSIYSGSILGLLTQEEKTRFLQDCLVFYRTALETLLLPPEAEEDALTALRHLQSTVRHLPFSLEERQRVLAKLTYSMRSLEDAEASLEQWADGVQEVSSSETQPIRFRLLEKWITLVRVFLSLRSWDVQSPTVFLLDHPSLEEYRPPPILSSQAVLGRMDQRIDTVWQRLGLLAEREIANLHMERLEALEGLLARTQFDYADALVQEQERLLDSLKEGPPEADTEDAPETGVFDRVEKPGEEKK
jgi:tetratricopeptide (TPR) repeat protein